MITKAIEKIAGLGSSWFQWLMFENDPDKKARRLQQKDHAHMKKIALRSLKLRIRCRKKKAIPLTKDTKTELKILDRKIERDESILDNLHGLDA